MQLFHGSNVEVREPKLLKIQRDLDGYLPAQVAIAQLLPQRLNDQVVFKSDRALGSLRFIEVKNA